jgi:hypothetical protein
MRAEPVPEVPAWDVERYQAAAGELADEARGIVKPALEQGFRVETKLALQRRIWQAAAEVARREPGPIPALLLEALNQMFDLSLSVRQAYEQRVPPAALRLLVGGSLLSVGAVGYQFGMTGRRPVVIFSLLLAFSAFAFILVVDLDRPRSGNIRVDPAPLIWTLEGLPPPG